MKKLIILLILSTMLLETISFADGLSEIPTMRETLKIHSYEDRAMQSIDINFFYSAAFLYMPRIFAKDELNKEEGIFGVALCLGSGLLYQLSGKGYFQTSYEAYQAQLKPEMTDSEKEVLAFKEVKKIADNHKSQRILGSLALAALGALSAATDLKTTDHIYAENLRLTGYGFTLWGLYEAIYGTTIFEDNVTKYENYKAKETIKISVAPHLDSISLNGTYIF